MSQGFPRHVATKTLGRQVMCLLDVITIALAALIAWVCLVSLPLGIFLGMTIHFGQHDEQC